MTQELAPLSWQEMGLGSLFLTENVIELMMAKGIVSKEEAEATLSKTVNILAGGSGEIADAAEKLKARWENQGYSL